ncbi:MAG: alpha/beta hydrolase [Candidatus Bathyarchaeia archaeon]
MYRAKLLILITTLAVWLTISGYPAIVSSAPPFWPEPLPGIRPVIFVHGGSGSGAQFESQAMRFMSNGYPLDYLWVLEYDSSFKIETMEDVWSRLDELISVILAQTSAEKVDLMGHSLGTRVLLGYLATPERRAKVAHYVNIDGSSGASAPEGVPTLGIWSAPGREIKDAVKNVWIPNQTHVEVATSAEAFVEIFKFLTGQEPWTKDIVPEPPGQIRLAGRVVYFPWNTGVEGATLEIWEVDGNTGMRTREKPEAVYFIDADGSWGPFEAKAGLHYEFAVTFTGPLGLETIHYYREPFIRSDYFIRILVSIPGGVAYLGERSPRHSAMLILRYKEFWGDQAENNDVLEINGINVVTDKICPRIKLVNGIWVYDKNCDGISDLTKPIDVYYALIFQTGVDLFIPAADPPNATISLVLTTRFGGGKTQVINVPNWASLTEKVLHRIVVQFNDYLQEINSFQEYMRQWRP